MPATYDSIATGSGAAPIVFSNIPQTFTDLRLVIVGNANFELQINGNTGSIYSQTFMQAISTSGTATSGRFNNGNRWWLYSSLYSANALTTVDLFSYTNTNYVRQMLSQFSNDANGSGVLYASAGIWGATTAITSITILNSTAISASLYGILRA